MHWIQKKILELAKIHNLSDITDTELMRLVGCDHQSQVRHHRDQLIKSGKLIKKGGRLTPALSTDAGLIRIPVMGEADCGEATKYADGRIYDYLTVSPSILATKNLDKTYALIARGSSMNHAKVTGKEIEDGDYLIVERHATYDVHDGEIIVSNIGGLANVKRFKRDLANNRIVLIPDSYRQHDYAPIIISEDDDYNILGKVVDVVKAIT